MQEVHVPIMQITGLTGARGPQIGKLQQQLLSWQLAHPDASSVDLVGAKAAQHAWGMLLRSSSAVCQGAQMLT